MYGHIIFCFASQGLRLMYLGVVPYLFAALDNVKSLNAMSIELRFQWRHFNSIRIVGK